jgi:hypothetical protein
MTDYINEIRQLAINGDAKAQISRILSVQQEIIKQFSATK